MVVRSNRLLSVYIAMNRTRSILKLTILVVFKYMESMYVKVVIFIKYEYTFCKNIVKE